VRCLMSSSASSPLTVARRGCLLPWGYLHNRSRKLVTSQEVILVTGITSVRHPLYPESGLKNLSNTIPPKRASCQTAGDGLTRHSDQHISASLIVEGTRRNDRSARA
jgi:hypothetical protein